MNRFLLLIYVIACLLSCESKQNDSNLNADESSAAIKPVSITLFTDKVELFAEFNPFVVGEESAFAAHLNDLKDFKPVTKGVLQVILKNRQNSYENIVDAPSVPGIYRPVITPGEPGIYTLVFLFSNDRFSETITIDSMVVYQNRTDIPEGTNLAAGNDLVYLKEQAWKVEFATAPAVPGKFSEIIKTSGEILPAQGDEMEITAGASGLIHFDGNKVVSGDFVNAGDLLFTVSGGNLIDGNTETQFLQAKAAYEKAKNDYDRGQELVKENIISQKEFQDITARYESEQAKYSSLSRNYLGGGQNVVAPVPGYLKNIKVSEGQYVTAGHPLASVSRNRKLNLRTEISQKYFSKLSEIMTANFRTIHDNKTFSLESMNGRLLSYGRSSEESTLFVPVIFTFDNNETLVPGSMVEVFLKMRPFEGAIAIPETSLIEEQGVFYAYVQTGGESFSKRELTLGGNDGINVHVLAGIKEGERVVTKGAYQIKLATASGTIPAHGHAH